ncbi:MAG: Gfo/Idh/MocA family oxidoreductase [Acidimicrobiales bacterium]
MPDRSSPLHIGIVGCGLIGRFHARSLQPVADRARVTTVFDLDMVRATEFADEFGAEVAPSLDALIADVDAVYVCTWTAAHRSIVEQAVEAGRPVFCEKPLDVGLAEARSLTELVLGAEVTNQVGLVLRRSPAMRWVAQRLASGVDGGVMSIVFRDDQYFPTQGTYASTWRGDRSLAGSGALLEHSIHDLDLLDWWIGPITSVAAMTAHHHRIDGIEDQATVLLRGEGDAVATLSSTWHDVLSRPSQRRIEIFCRRATITVEGEWTGPVRWESETDSGVLEGAELVASVRSDGHTQNPDREFVDAVIAGTSAHPDVAVALRAHVLADAAYRSAADGGAAVTVS